MVVTTLSVLRACAVTGDYLIDVWSSEDGSEALFQAAKVQFAKGQSGHANSPDLLEYL